MNKRKLIRLLWFISGLLILLVFLKDAGTWLIKKDECRHADAMVILMGSISDRVLQAADLYHAKNARDMVMADTRLPDEEHSVRWRGITEYSNTQQARLNLMALGVPADRITILPGRARSTLMEAKMVSVYLKNRPDIDTVFLVTSSQHTRRASMIFETVLDQEGLEVTILCCPSRHSQFKGTVWWTSWYETEKVVLEYLKMVNFFLFERWKI